MRVLCRPLTDFNATHCFPKIWELKFLSSARILLSLAFYLPEVCLDVIFLPLVTFSLFHFLLYILSLSLSTFSTFWHSAIASGLDISMEVHGFPGSEQVLCMSYGLV